MKKILSLIVICLVIFGLGSASISVTPTHALGTSCGLTSPAFCDTFDVPAGTGNRSGDLNGTVWGVSRTEEGGEGYGQNQGQGAFNTWVSTTLNACGNNQTVSPDRDVQICNGTLVDAVNDDHGQTILAAYPKQPFDIAGRTGIVSFDVSNDTQGTHAAWPEFWYTDQPVPTPNNDQNGTGLSAVDTRARNGLGVQFAGLCGAGTFCGAGSGAKCFTVSALFTETNYTQSNRNFTIDNCVTEATGPNGLLNHIELHISNSSVVVYATNPGSSTLVQIAHANVTVPLTRGLIWIEDVHYNADKFNTQRVHTFTWDNVGFDGPVLPKDLTFDVPENDTVYNGSSIQLGWEAPVTLHTLPLANLSQATGAALLFNDNNEGNSITYSLNGNTAHKVTLPNSQTVAISISTTELLNGVSNTIKFSGDTDIVSNVDILLMGAGGGTVPPTSTPVVTNTPIATSTISPTVTITPTVTPVPTFSPTNSPTATASPTATPRPSQCEGLAPGDTVEQIIRDPSGNILSDITTQC